MFVKGFNIFEIIKDEIFMDDLFQNRFKIRSARLQNWNYNSAAVYFITICTKERMPFLGHIENEKVILTEVGKFAADEWQRTPEIRYDMNISLGEYIVMPDHFHSIIFIKENEFNSEFGSIKQNKDNGNKFSPQRKNLPSIIRGFKSAVTSFSKTKGIEFGWQSRYWEHMIRTEEELQTISQYIINNPSNYGGKNNPLRQND